MGALSTIAIVPRTMAPFAISLLHEWAGAYQYANWLLFAVSGGATILFFAVAAGVKSVLQQGH